MVQTSLAFLFHICVCFLLFIYPNFVTINDAFSYYRFLFGSFVFWYLLLFSLSPFLISFTLACSFILREQTTAGHIMVRFIAYDNSYKRCDGIILPGFHWSGLLSEVMTSVGEGEVMI